MKQKDVRVTKHKLAHAPGPNGQIAKLEITCESPWGTKLVFHVDDTPSNRDTWALGKPVDLHPRPGIPL